MLAQIYTIKQNYFESIDDFCYRLGNIAQKMDMPEKELDFHKLEAFIKGIKDNAIRVEIARDKKNLSYGKAIIAAKQLEAFFSTDDTDNVYSSKIEKVHDNRKFESKKRNKYRSGHLRSYTQNYSFRKKDDMSRNASLGASRDERRHRNNHIDENEDRSRSFRGRVEGIFVPYDNFMATSGIIMKPSWCYANNGLLHLPCVNTTNDPVTIYRNKIIGSFEPVKSAEFGHVSVCKLDKANHDHKEGQINSGWKDINILYDKLKIDSLPLSGSEKDQLKKVISKYSDCFATHPYDLGKCTMYKAHIEMEKDARPVWVPSRAVPYNMQKFMDKEIKSMKDSGMIEDCKFSLWNSQTFLIPKKNNKFRVVQDCRNINKASMPDKFELPNLNHLLDGLKETTYLSTFDFVSSFSQIPLSKSSRPYFAFNYNGSRYQFKRLVQGHKTSSSQFSRMMQRLLGKANISNLLWFVDDLVLGSNSVLDHIKRMELLFQRLRFANLKLSPDKSEIFQSSIKFVGMTVSNKGIAIDKDRVKAIVNLKSPTTVRDLQKVLGIFQYSRKYIRNFASISQPLYALLQRNTKFVWSNECEEAMKTLKNAITQAPVLGIANPNGQFEVTCDASA
ncbi:hypothetical protein ACHWQZ_G011636 [Mnemiopsis leidyi]